MDSSSFNELRLDTGPAEEDGLDSGTDVERVRSELLCSQVETDSFFQLRLISSAL